MRLRSWPTRRQGFRPKIPPTGNSIFSTTCPLLTTAIPPPDSIKALAHSAISASLLPAISSVFSSRSVVVPTALGTKSPEKTHGDSADLLVPVKHRHLQ